MQVKNIVKCPTCGQSANPREIKISKKLVDAMIDVFKWSEEKGKHEFSRKEIDHILKKDGTVYANFGYVVWATSFFYHPNGRGTWGINKPRMIEFLQGRRKIATRLMKDPLKPKADNLTLLEYATINEVPEFKQSLNENHEFVVNYLDTKAEQAGMFEEGQIPKKRSDHNWTH